MATCRRRRGTVYWSGCGVARPSAAAEIRRCACHVTGGPAGASNVGSAGASRYVAGPRASAGEPRTRRGGAVRVVACEVVARDGCGDAAYSGASGPRKPNLVPAGEDRGRARTRRGASPARGRRAATPAAAAAPPPPEAARRGCRLRGRAAGTRMAARAVAGGRRPSAGSRRHRRVRSCDLRRRSGPAPGPAGHGERRASPPPATGVGGGGRPSRRRGGAAGCGCVRSDGAVRVPRAPRAPRPPTAGGRVAGTASPSDASSSC